MKKHVTVVIDDELWKKFKIIAIKENKSCSEMLEEIVHEKVKR